MMTFDWMIGKPQQELESLETGNGRVYVDTANLYSFGKHYGKERVLVLFAVKFGQLQEPASRKSPLWER
jgi:hypothetical protein